MYASAVAKGIELPDTWKDFSQHGYAAKPLRNDFCGADEILEFRDKAFDTYFSHQPYLDLVRRTFGQDVVDHIERMKAVPLRRKLLEDRRAA